MALTFTIEVVEHFQDFAASAILRAGYLYPDSNFDLRNGKIIVESSDDTANSPERIERDFRHLLYREKIYAETLGLRHQLIDALTER